MSITSVLNRKNGFAQRAKLAQKLRCRKGTKSNFCDKVFVGYEPLLCFVHYIIYLLIDIFLQKYIINKDIQKIKNDASGTANSGLIKSEVTPKCPTTVIIKA